MKEIIKALRLWPLCGELTGHRLIPHTQMTSNAENASIWWRHHEEYLERVNHAVDVWSPFVSSLYQVINWLIEQFYYVTFWHSKVKTDTFITYHIQVYI